MTLSASYFSQVVHAGKIYVKNNSAATAYYTSGVANDNNSGTASSPVATIVQAVAMSNVGDSIFIDIGNYYESVTISKKLFLFGANAYISPNTVTRSGESVLNSSGMATIEIITNDFVSVQGLQFITTTGDAILSYYSNTNLKLEKNLFDSSKGIFLLNPDSLFFIDNRF